VIVVATIESYRRPGLSPALRSGMYGRCGRACLSPGFTLIELLVVIAIVAILASMLLPTLARSKQKAQGIQCMNHHRQLAMAWRMYAEDNRDRITYAGEDLSDPSRSSAVWVLGRMDFDPNNRANWDVEVGVKKSPLWQYCKSAGVWKCPSDRSFVKVGSVIRPRVRSMTASIWMGGFGGAAPTQLDPGWKVFLSLSDMNDPGPSKSWVFIDQREDSINWGNYFTDMVGFPDRPVLRRFAFDYPASYHSMAGGLSFADGHSEIKRWRDPRTVPPIRKGADALYEAGFVNSPNNPDLGWLQERSTRRK
jgi:prepilin-type N-terminal cleavage/methylation domain-containing protein